MKTWRFSAWSELERVCVHVTPSQDLLANEFASQLYLSRKGREEL
jgi:hypothetical protein